MASSLLIIFIYAVCSGKISWNLLSILAVLNNAVVLMVSTRPPASKPPSPFNNPLVTVTNALITICIMVIFMFHNFFNSQARSSYLSFLSLSFSFILWLAGTVQQSSQFFKLFFFLFFTIRSGLLAEIRWSVCTSKSHRNLCVSFPRTTAGLRIYHLFVW